MTRLETHTYIVGDQFFFLFSLNLAVDSLKKLNGELQCKVNTIMQR